MFKLKGSCHCTNILVNADLSRQPDSFNPRACDCDFCLKHGASYVSDPEGTLSIRVKDMRLLGRYKQGSDTADFLFCLSCGVLVGVTYQSGGQLFATINSQVIDENPCFGDKTPVSPKKLNANEKTKRWQEVWFSNVALVSSNE